MLNSIDFKLKLGIVVDINMDMIHIARQVSGSRSKPFLYPRNEVRGGILESPCPSVRLSVVRIWVSGA